jgi:hypothetical protein
MPLLSTIGAAAARAFGFLKALVTGGYEVDNSLRFNSGSSDYLNRTLSTPTNNKIYTWSGWIKKTKNDESAPNIFGAHSGGSRDCIRFDGGGNALQMIFNEANSGNLVTTQLLRDVSAWYHIVVAVDTTQATSTNRVKIYLNGSQITSFSTSSYPAQNYINIINAANSHVFGKNADLSNEFFNGYIAETYFIDGQQLTPSSFGETDPAIPSSGIWIPKAYTGSFGNNGFYLQFKNSAALGTDSSGNGNTFTVNNLTSVDQMTDTPTLNYCTLNPLMKSTADVVLTQGNLNMVSNFASGWQNAGSTFAVKTGKWYWEAKATVVSATDKTSIGVIEFDTTQVDFIGNTNKDLASFGISGHGAGTGSYTYAQGDIIMCAMDVTNNKVYWGKNGTFYGTLDPAAGTGTVTQTINNNNFCMPVVGGYGGSTWEMNFGIPQFTVSSGNSDANGYGNFEYAVPSGFYALNTKNLADYG